MNDATLKQLAIISEISDALTEVGVSWWLFGGWGLDACIGRVTRDHHDIEFWVNADDAGVTRDALVARGFVVMNTQPPEESREFERDGTRLSSAFFYLERGSAVGTNGRWSDWRFPLNSFGDAIGRLGELEVPVMSVEGMLAMKEQFPSLRNGKPLRDKDIKDLELLRKLVRETT